MLVKLTPGSRDPRMAQVLNAISENRIDHIEIMPGVYEVGHWNPEYIFREKLSDVEDRDYSQPFDFTTYMQKERERRDKFNELYKEYGIKYREFSEYGVCDNPMQILARWPHLVYSEEKYAITCVKIRKEDQSDWGGWRWHKWGEYIGVRHPKREYIYDEPVIRQVFTFHIYRVGE